MSCCSTKVFFLCPGIVCGIIFPEILQGIEVVVIACTDIPFATDGKSCCKPSCYSCEVGFLRPCISGRIKFPEIIESDVDEINVVVMFAGANIPLAADREAYR